MRFWSPTTWASMVVPRFPANNEGSNQPKNPPKQQKLAKNKYTQMKFCFRKPYSWTRLSLANCATLGVPNNQ